MRILFFLVLLLSWNLHAQQDSFKKQYDAIISKLPNHTEGGAELAERLLEEARAAHNEEYVAKAYFLLGAIKYYDSRYYLSCQFYTKALESAYAKKNAKFREFCYNNRGNNYDNLNNLPEAMKDYNLSYKIAETRSDSSAMAQTLLNIALLDAQSRNYAAAEKTNKEVLVYFLAKQDTANVALCYQNLGLVFKDQAKWDLALEHSFLALAYHKATRYDYGIVQVLFTIGEIYSLQGKTTSSDSFLLKALSHLETAKIEMEAMQGYIYVHLGKNGIERNEFRRTEEYLEKAYQLLMNSGITNNMEVYYFAAMEYAARTGDFERYKRQEEEYIRYVERQEQAKSLGKYNELKSFYGYEQREARIKQQQSEMETLRIKIVGLLLLLVVIVVAVTFILHYYRKSKRYLETLYEANMKSMSAVAHCYASGKEDLNAPLYNQILDVMREERLYLDPDFTIADLAHRMGTNSKYISQAINGHSSLNFNSFINTYRINEAKRMILTNGNAIALKVIGAEVGFNNHTTFYRQFKEITGLKPTEFVELSKKNRNEINTNVA